MNLPERSEGAFGDIGMMAMCVSFGYETEGESEFNSIANEDVNSDEKTQTPR